MIPATKNTESNAATGKPGLSAEAVDKICAVLLLIGVVLMVLGYLLGLAVCIWCAIPALLASAIFASLHRNITVRHSCVTFGLVLISIGLALHVV
jgi:uncharacterized membrane protein